MALGKGWKDFVKANGLQTGDSFTLELIWEDTTPVLSLCPAECIIDKEAGGLSSETTQEKSVPIEPSSCRKSSKEESNKEESSSWERENNHLRWRGSTPLSQKQYVTLTIQPSSAKKYILRLPRKFTRENDINKPGMLTLLGKDGMKQQAKLLFDQGNRAMTLGNGWKDFANANGLKVGDSFTLKLIWEDTTPVLSLCPAEYSIDNGAEGECSEASENESLPIEPSSCTKISKDENSKEESSKDENSIEEISSWERWKGSTPLSPKKIVTLKITPSSFTKCRLILPVQFVRENSMIKPGGIIYLSRKDGAKWLTTLHQDKKGTMSMGKGWIEFAEANDLKSGESFRVELIWEDATPMLSLVCSKANEKESISTEPNEKEPIFTEPRSRDSSSAIQNRFVTLALTPEDVRACKMHLPSQFMKANGIDKLGEIILLGENGREWSGYLMSKDGTVALGKGWDEFCEANGVKIGESFTLEFINKQDKTSPVLKFCSQGD